MKTSFKKAYQIEELNKIRPYELGIIYRKQKTQIKREWVNNLNLDTISDLFIELEFDEKRILLELLEPKRQKELLTNLEDDELKEFIIELPIEERELIFKILPIVKGKTMQLLLAYDEDLAASIMTMEYIQINSVATIKEATHKLITQSKDNDYIETIFIVENDRLIGTVDLRDLIIARGDESLKDLMDDDFHFVYENEKIEKAIETIQSYDEKVLPVINQNHRLLGIITAEDIFDELVESHDLNYQRLAFLNDHEMESSVTKRVKQRIPWLMMDAVVGLLLAFILSFFEATFVEIAALVLFQPLILGMAGNIGTQSLAVTILALHVGDISHHKIPKTHIIKEMAVGFINGLLLGICAFLFAFTFLSIIPIGNQKPYEIGFVVFVAIFGAMFISASISAVVPILFKKLNIDPAAASGPIMTTVNDIVALVLYFGFATLIFIL